MATGGARASIVFIALALAWPTGPAAAQSKADKVKLVAVTDAGAVADAVSVTTTNRIARAQIALTNPDLVSSLEVKPGAQLRNLETGDGVTASWSIPAEGIRPRNGILQLAPNSTTVLQVEGVLAAAGTYVSTLDVLDAGATGKVFSVAITRTVAAVPPELLVEPRPARIDIPFPRLRSPDPGVVRLTAHNATAGTVDVHKAVIGRFSALDGDVQTTVAGPGTPSVASDGCGGQIESQKTCTVAISFPADLSAGRYAADIVIGGPGGNQSARTVLLDVRLSPRGRCCLRRTSSTRESVIGADPGRSVAWRGTNRPFAASTVVKTARSRPRPTRFRRLRAWDATPARVLAPGDTNPQLAGDGG